MIFSLKTVECTINLDDAPTNDKYNPLDNTVYTTITVNFPETESICMIKCGLIGVCDTETHVRKQRFDAAQNRMVSHRYAINEHYEFLNNYSYFSMDGQQTSQPISDVQQFVIPKGTTLSQGFSFEIPNDRYLPSSSPPISTFDDKFLISYRVYVEVYKIGGLFIKKPKVSQSFIKEIHYQSGKARNYTQNISNAVLDYRSIQSFDNKVKKFYYDDKTKALIPTSLTENHSHTRFIRKLWNDDYKKEHYEKITKTIPLRLKFSINESFNIYAPLITQFNSILSVDLKSIGIDSNKTTDFVFNGQSTQLGVFKIKSFYMVMSNIINVRCQNKFLSFSKQRTLCNATFQKLDIDVINFQYDKANDRYRIEFPPGLLIEKSKGLLNKSISDLVKDDTIMCTGSVETWFENKTTLKCTWIITDGMLQEREYKFQTSASPDILY